MLEQWSDEVAEYFICIQKIEDAAINFCHNHPPVHPRGFAPKICSHSGASASLFLPGGADLFGVGPDGRAFVYSGFNICCSEILCF